MKKDYVGVAWEDIRPHIEDDLRIGAFEMTPEQEARFDAIMAPYRAQPVDVPMITERITFFIPMEDLPVHSDDHPYCNDMKCPCHKDEERNYELYTWPLREGLMTIDEAQRLYRGQQIR